MSFETILYFLTDDVLILSDFVPLGAQYPDLEEIIVGFLLMSCREYIINLIYVTKIWIGYINFDKIFLNKI